MKRKQTLNFLAAVIVFLSCFINVSAQKLAWRKFMSGYSNDVGYAICEDPWGHVYTTGIFYSDSIDFDPGPGTYYLHGNGAEMIFISKLDSLGNFIWAKKLDGGFYDQKPKAISTDNQGRIYLTGYFNGTVDFDPDTGTYYLTAPSSIRDAFICVLDSAGSFAWAKSLGGNWVYDGATGYSIAVDALNNVYTTGSFNDILIIDPGAAADTLYAAWGESNFFLTKMNSSGDLVWAECAGGTGGIGAVSLCLDSAANIYLSGAFHGTVDFDPGPGISNASWGGSGEPYVMKLDSSGHFIWAKQWRNNSAGNAACITTDGHSNLYIGGVFKGWMDLDPGPDTVGVFNNGISSTNSNDIFVCRMDTSGNFIWGKHIGGEYDDVIYAIAADTVGNVFSTGYFTNKCDFDPGPGNFNLYGGSYSPFVNFLDSSGNFVWANYPWSDVRGGNDIKLGKNHSVLITGYFTSFNSDLFIEKMGICTMAQSTISDTACYNYYLTSWNTSVTSSGRYTNFIPNSLGCDDRVNIDLTIVGLDTTITQNGATLTSNDSGAIYMWLDCNAGYSAVNGAINQSFTAASNGSYALYVVRDGCSHVTRCYQVTGVGIDEPLPGQAPALFPNPVKNSLTIRASREFGMTKIQIYNVIGEIITEKHFESKDEIREDVSSFSSGLYIVKVVGTDFQYFAKFVKE